MKKLIATLSLALVVTLGAVGFSACKKTNPEGTYTFKSVSIEKIDANAEGSIEEGKAMIEAQYKDAKIVVMKGGIGEMIMKMGEQEHKQQFTWTKDKSVVTVKVTGSADVEQKWTIKGKTITQTNEEGGFKVTLTFSK